LAAQPAAAAIIIDQLAPADPAYSRQLTTITGKTNVANDTRLFVTSKAGQISYYDQAAGSYTPFRNLSSYMNGVATLEHGLLGIAFDPGYATNGQYYAYLTRTIAPGSVSAQVVRLTDPAISSAPESVVWSMDIGSSLFHIGGWIDFDTTGKLLVAIGEGGTYLAPDIQNTGQNPADWWGSILRIDPNAADAYPADPGRNYGIPGDNPAIAGAAEEVFVYGVRNPFRNTIAPDGNLIVADVGFEQREELTIVEKDSPDRNLGWSLREGDIATPGVGGPAPADYQAPDLVYDHSEGAAIIGGFVYRGSAVPELYGRYVFGDQVSGNIWSIGYVDGAFVGTKTLIGNISSLVSFGETADGELVAVRFGGLGSAIYRFTSDSPPVAAVPEPSSWAMMIGGFSLLGGTLRRRGRLQAARRPV
jgi:glucose/arabinose dehydrogenase